MSTGGNGHTLLLTLAALLLGGGAAARGDGPRWLLIGTDTGSDGRRNALYTVSQETGAFEHLIDLPRQTRPQHVAWRPGNSRALFTLSGGRNRLAFVTVSLTTGEAKTHELKPSDFGFPPETTEFEFNGIAISTRRPEVVAIAATVYWDRDKEKGDFQKRSSQLAHFNLRTLTPLGRPVRTQRMLATLTYEPGTNRLLACEDFYDSFGPCANPRGPAGIDILEVDPDTGRCAVLCTVPVAAITGLAIHPTTGTWFAINGYTFDTLINFDPATGKIIRTFEPIGMRGAGGLVFATALNKTAAP